MANCINFTVSRFCFVDQQKMLRLIKLSVPRVSVSDTVLQTDIFQLKNLNILKSYTIA